MKKKLMRALYLVSIVTMMVGCAISCGKTKESSLTVTTVPSTAETTTAIETEPAAEPGNSYCIDHIFVNDKTDVKLFNVVIDHDVANTSDHIPIYADIDLK